MLYSVQSIVNDLVNWCTRVIAVFGLPGIFVLMLLESACIPIPAEATMMFAGFAASQGKLGLAAVLWGLGLSAAAVQRELEATREAVIAKTNNRSLLGTLNDFSLMLKWQLQGRQDIDLVQAALELAHTPVAPLRPLGFPDKVTWQLLEG
jgi:hypothetical protein